MLHDAPQFDVSRLYALEEERFAASGSYQIVLARRRIALESHRDLSAEHDRQVAVAKSYRAGRVGNFDPLPDGAEVDEAKQSLELITAEEFRQAARVQELGELADQCRRFLFDAGYSLRREVRP